jgi:hypothetical protein
MNSLQITKKCLVLLTQLSKSVLEKQLIAHVALKSQRLAEPE